MGWAIANKSHEKKKIIQDLFAVAGPVKLLAYCFCIFKQNCLAQDSSRELKLLSKHMVMRILNKSYNFSAMSVKETAT
jgi:hypothetical protein